MGAMKGYCTGQAIAVESCSLGCHGLPFPVRSRSVSCTLHFDFALLLVINVEIASDDATKAMAYG
jgi:hypothetical protein